MQRNFQKPTKKNNFFDGKPLKDADGRPLDPQKGEPTIICSHCKAEIPHKSGFRPSALKCPKCGK
ncbi:MAG: hypothetical protein WC955_11665 [Elusimicrobiota bacterium]